ncbi:hypothetical protein TNCV_782611 [Trichonephila clavipes]|nr:hypothetical protein TNCV_782611 [Trichonephila clavipes]
MGFCNELMNVEPGGLIGNALSFLKNPSVISKSMMEALMLDAVAVNAAFQSALSNVIVAELRVIVWDAVIRTATSE